jgi:hypothetical protein
MANDFYLEAARERQNAIELELASCKADLLAHRQNGSLSEAGEAIQRIANLTAEQSNLQSLAQGYIQSQQPRQPERLSDEEKAAKPIHRMNYNDVLEMARTSKYAKDLTWNADMQAGYDEVRARRSRGE